MGKPTNGQLQDFACKASDLLWGGQLAWARDKDGLERLWKALKFLIKTLRDQRADAAARAEQAESENEALHKLVDHYRAENEHALTRLAEAYQIFGVLDAELDLFDDALILDVFSRPDDKREVTPFELPARAQTLLAIVKAAEEWSGAKNEDEMLIAEKALCAAVQAYRSTHTSNSEDKPSR